jgi:hypothetical protein
VRLLHIALDRGGVLGAAETKAPLGGHLWHVIEALAFMVMSLGGIGVSEVVQNRRKAAAGDFGRLQGSFRNAYGAAAAVGGPSTWGLAGPTSKGTTSRTALLPIVGLGSLAAASVHYVVMPRHFAEATIYGCFFMVAATVQVIFGLLTLARPSRPLIAVGLAGNMAVIVLWLITRTVGIPLGPSVGSTEAVGGLDILATIFETIIVVASLTLLWRWREPAPTSLRPSTWAWQIWIFIVAAPLAIAITTVVQPPS